MSAIQLATLCVLLETFLSLENNQEDAYTDLYGKAFVKGVEAVMASQEIGQAKAAVCFYQMCDVQKGK